MLRGHIVLLPLLGLPLTLMAQTAPVEPKPTAEVSKFVMGTRLGYITCSEKYKAYLEKWELYALVTEGQRAPQGTPPSDADVADCIHQTALRGNALYKDALRSAETPKAKAAFSEYMVAWDSALKTIRKPGRETVQQYRVRQKQVEERLNTLQARLEVSSPSG
jgi:hypothetical protein